MPVKLGICPARALAYRPLTSRCSATASGVSTKTSTNSSGAEQFARHPPLRAERRDEAHQHDQAGIDHQPGDLGDAADVLDAVLVGEAQVLVEAVADVVAVEQEGVVAERVQPLLDQVGDRRLARARQAGEPQAARHLAPCCARARPCRRRGVASGCCRRGAARSRACRQRRWRCSGGRSG